MSSTNSSAPKAPEPVMPTFERTPLPDFSNPNQRRRGPIVRTTAACLNIGDEVLNGKTKDSNSNYFAKFCFDLGIDLKRIEVIPDDEEVIVEAAKRLTSHFDFVVSSGGYRILRRRHDVSIHGQGLFGRRKAGVTTRGDQADGGEPQGSTGEHLRITEDMITARKRMALFPAQHAEVFSPPTSSGSCGGMAGKLCILPAYPYCSKRSSTDSNRSSP